MPIQAVQAVQAGPWLDKLSHALHTLQLPPWSASCVFFPACERVQLASSYPSIALKRASHILMVLCSLSDHDSSICHSMSFKSQRILNAYALAKLLVKLIQLTFKAFEKAVVVMDSWQVAPEVHVLPPFNCYMLQRLLCPDLWLSMCLMGDVYMQSVAAA